MSVDQIRVPLVFHHDDNKPTLSLRVTDRGGATVVEVIGELDLASAHLLTDCVDRIAGDRPDRVVLDLTGVSFFCADGLRALLHARDTVTGTGGQLLLRAPSANARRVLDLTAADELFIFDAPDQEP
jgi:anti-anti-sigma factor